MAATLASKDQRRHLRSSLTSFCSCSDGRYCHLVVLRDISPAGAKIEGRERFSPESQVTLFLPSNPRIAVKGRVSWVETTDIAHHVGIRFSGVTPEQKDRIQALCGTTAQS